MTQALQALQGHQATADAGLSTPLLRAPAAAPRRVVAGNSRAVGVEPAPGRAEFADALTKAQTRPKKRAEKGEHGGESGPSKKAEERREAKDVEERVRSDQADRPDRGGNTGGPDAECVDCPVDGGNAESGALAEHPGADGRAAAEATGASAVSDVEAEPGAGTSSSESAKDAPGAASTHPHTAHELAIALTTRPPTITIVNEVILQGGTSPRFALVAPGQRPGAVKAASEGGGADAQRSARPAGQDQVVGPSATTADPMPAKAGAAAETPAVAPAPRATPPASNADRGGRGAKAQAPSGPETVSSPTPVVPAGPERAAQTVLSPSAVVSQSAGQDGAKPVGHAPNSTAASRLLDRLAPSSGSPRAQAAPGDAQSFAAQLQRGLAQALQQAATPGAANAALTQGGNVTLRLQPAALGQLRIHLKLDKGAVSARFEASTARARDLLETSVAGLRDSLGERGLSVRDLSVSIAPRLPERELGLPPVVDRDGESAQAQAAAQSQPAHPGAAFANPDQQPPSGGRGGGAPHTDNQTTGSHGRDAAVDVPLDLGPLAGVGGLTYTLGPDGRVSLSALA